MRTGFLEGDLHLPASHEPSHDPCRLPRRVGTKQRLGREAVLGIADQHPPDRHDGQASMELRQDELEEEAVWAEAFEDPSTCWDLHSDDLEVQSDDLIDALANLLVPDRK